MDYGCGGGAPLAGVKKRFDLAEAAGVDISDYAIRKNKELFPECEFFTVDEFWKNNRRYDNILSSHTFEHIENPLLIAEKLLQNCKESFTIIVPCGDSWKDCEQHLWRFDRHSFDKLRPTFAVGGLTNWAGNSELIFHWAKNRKVSRLTLALFRIRKQFKISPSDLVKKIYLLITK